MLEKGRLNEFTLNPQAFVTAVAKQINRALRNIVVNGIKYEQIEGKYYEMRLFEKDDLEEYLNRLYQVQSEDNRTPYDYISIDSEMERDMAKKLDNHENVRFYCKLPRWFVIPTPIGDYNPDWPLSLNTKRNFTWFAKPNTAMKATTAAIWKI